MNARPSSHRPSLRRRVARRWGTHAVEFAVAAPILFFFVMGSIELGRMHMVRHTIDNAVYEGTRRGLVMGSTNADVVAKVNTILIAGGVRNPTTNCDIQKDTVTVSTSVHMNDNSWAAPFFFKNRDIGSSLTLRRR